MTDWVPSSVGMGDLPAGTVTLLLADVESSTRLWEREPLATMASVSAQMDAVIGELVAAHHGARPLEQGEGDSFVAGFARATDAVACALAIQRADVTPLRLRIGVHTGEVLVSDDGRYQGIALNRTARLRELAYGGQTLLSGTTCDLVVDHLPTGAWLRDLGIHRLRDLTRPERVNQLCADDVRNDFPPLRSLDSVSHNLPVQLTSFIGRDDEMAEVASLLAESRLVTLTGAGGAGKTRLALQLAATLSPQHRGVWHVDLAPLTDPDAVGTTTVRAMGVLDDGARAPAVTIAHHLGSAPVLVVLDNCEHVIEPCARLVDDLLRTCPSLTVMATSREPLGVAGEVTYRVPSLQVDGPGHAVALFVDRARRSRPGFSLGPSNTATIAEICHRLSGIPLAIELAAARVRVFTPDQIRAGLDDRFRLLTGGTRTALPRQHTLRASVDWSYHLLTEPERVLFRRLAVFAGGFDLGAAMTVAAGDGLDAHHVLDLLALLVDKSLVVADDSEDQARYLMLETIRQYALELLAESGEADDVRRRHRRHYVTLVRDARSEIDPDFGRWLAAVSRELDNFRVAFSWSLAVGESSRAQGIAASLWPVWLRRGLFGEGIRWLEDAIEHDPERLPVARVAALNVLGLLAGYMHSAAYAPRADEALTLARGIDDPHLLLRSLHAAGNAYLVGNPRRARDFYQEAFELAVAIEEGGIPDMLNGLADAALMLGDIVEASRCRAASIAALERLGWGDSHLARQERQLLAEQALIRGDLADCVTIADSLLALPDLDSAQRTYVLYTRGLAAALLGDHGEAASTCQEALRLSLDVGFPIAEANAHLARGKSALALGDLIEARRHLRGYVDTIPDAHAVVHAYALFPLALAELAAGDVEAVRTIVTDLGARMGEVGPLLDGPRTEVEARLALADGDVALAEERCHRALRLFAESGQNLGVCDTLELLAGLLACSDRAAVAVRLLAAAEALRARTGYARWMIYREWFEQSSAAARLVLDDDEAFDRLWAEGAALETDGAVTYAERGRGERRRPTTGWPSLTPSEVEVARLVADGLPNKAIAERLFVSPRTVQAHLTHIYAKLGVTSRVQLAQLSVRPRS